MKDYDWLAGLFAFLLGMVLVNIFHGLAGGRELYPGQYSQVDPKIQHWFKSQKNPKNGSLCCTLADGELAEEDIRGDQYWTRWPGHDEWMPVPKDAVIHNAGNPNGAPVVWWYYEQGETKIRCFVPGSLM